MYQAGDQVTHDRFGLGRVRLDDGMTVLVRFADGVHECRREELRGVPTPEQSLENGTCHPALSTVNRMQAELIRSIKSSAAGRATVCAVITGTYSDQIAQALHDASIPVSVVNPARIAAFGETFLMLTFLCLLALVAAWQLREAKPR